MNEAAEPSARGSLIVEVQGVVRSYRANGRLPPEALEARLSAGALRLIDEKIDIERWYPVVDFAEVVDLEWEISADRSPEYAREMGAIAADKLFDLRIYPQLDYAERVVRVRNRAALIRQARLITSVTGTLYNFLEPEVRLETRSDSLEVAYSNAAALADVLRYTTEGFMNQINRRRGSTRRWSSERTGPDVVTFRMPLPSRLADEG